MVKIQFNWWIIPVTFFIIGWFGIFWTLNLANAEFTININSDNNTAQLYESIDNIASYEKCIDKKLTEDMKEDIAWDYINNVNFCYMNKTKTWIDPCKVLLDFWSDNTTSITVYE